MRIAPKDFEDGIDRPRGLEQRLSELISKTHPDKVPVSGEYLHTAFSKVADVIEDLQRQLEEANRRAKPFQAAYDSLVEGLNKPVKFREFL